jgi:MFS family permease
VHLAGADVQERTDWIQSTLITIAGIIGAFQIGKVAIAIPLLREDLGLSLLATSWIAGAYAVLGVVGGMAAGFFFSYFPLRYVIAFGLGLIAAGSFMGALASDATLLIASRVLEGIGFLAVVISCPTLLRSMVTPRTQQLVFALWATYMPIGTAFMMFLGPALMQGDWRWLWMLNAIVAGAHALLILVIKPAMLTQQAKRASPSRADITGVFKAGTPLLMAATFTLYTLQYFALTTFLPTFLIDEKGLSLTAAGTISALAVVANAIGNLSAGVVLRLGMPIWVIFTIVFSTIGISGVAIFAASSPVWLAVAFSGICLGFAALLPATIIITMPRLVSSTTQLALGMGMVQQASSIGQLGGPALLALWIGWLGWAGVPYLFGLLAVCGLTFAIVAKRTIDAKPKT